MFLWTGRHGAVWSSSLFLSQAVLLIFNSSELKHWDVLSDPLQLLFSSSEPLQVWKWLRDVWWAEEETPFTTALLSLWEFIINTQDGHTREYTHTHTSIHKPNPQWEIITHTYCIYTVCDLNTGGQMCTHHSPHHKLTSMNMFLWTSPAPPMQTGSPPTTSPPTGGGWRQALPGNKEGKPQRGHGVRACCSTVTWTTHIWTSTLIDMFCMFHENSMDSNTEIWMSGERLGWRTTSNTPQRRRRRTNETFLHTSNQIMVYPKELSWKENNWTFWGFRRRFIVQKLRQRQLRLVFQGSRKHFTTFDNVSPLKT